MQSPNPANAKQDVDSHRAPVTPNIGAALYLDLLKKSLTNNLFKTEPDEVQETMIASLLISRSTILMPRQFRCYRWRDCITFSTASRCD